MRKRLRILKDRRDMHYTTREHQTLILIWTRAIFGLMQLTIFITMKIRIDFALYFKNKILASLWFHSNIFAIVAIYQFLKFWLERFQQISASLWLNSINERYCIMFDFQAQHWLTFVNVQWFINFNFIWKSVCSLNA